MNVTPEIAIFEAIYPSTSSVRTVFTRREFGTRI